LIYHDRQLKHQNADAQKLQAEGPRRSESIEWLAKLLRKLQRREPGEV